MCVWCLFVEDVDSDDDDDFIEVAAKEGFEPTIPQHRREEYGLAPSSTVTSAGMTWLQKDHRHDVEDPTSLVASVMKRQQLEQEKEATKWGDYLVYSSRCINSHDMSKFVSFRA